MTLLVIAGFLAGAQSNAGSGPHRVAVVLNNNSRESQGIGHYYCDRRGIPEANLIHVVSTTNDTIALSEFQSQIFTPITNYLSQVGLMGQVDTIVYTRGIQFLSTMITAQNLEGARALVDRCMDADGSVPMGQILYVHSTDSIRNVRWPQFERADFPKRFFSVPWVAN